jgi:hypothetical protein
VQDLPSDGQDRQEHDVDEQRIAPEI